MICIYLFYYFVEWTGKAIYVKEKRGREYINQKMDRIRDWKEQGMTMKQVFPMARCFYVIQGREKQVDKGIDGINDRIVIVKHVDYKLTRYKMKENKQ